MKEGGNGAAAGGCSVLLEGIICHGVIWRTHAAALMSMENSCNKISVLKALSVKVLEPCGIIENHPEPSKVFSY